MISRTGFHPGWGNTPRANSSVLVPTLAGDLDKALEERHLGARGLGRSYGDACCGPLLLDTTPLRGPFELDQDRGILRVGAGRSLGEVMALTLPWGWAPAVLPGTRHVTVGGAIAADVHGKNHHAVGAFCAHVLRLRALLSDGRVLECSRVEEPELFQALCGGMGLCGLVLEATLRLEARAGGGFQRSTRACHTLDEALDRLRESTASHTVAWVDAATPGSALGRCLVHEGDPQEGPGPRDPAPEARFTLPFTLPVNGVRPPLMRAFNELVWRQGRRQEARPGWQAHGDFYWPLDAVGCWNRLYGPRGFLQFQCLVPEAAVEAQGAGPLVDLLRLFQGVGGASLAVMKTMGARDEGTAPIAFPGKGVTLALDLPSSAASREAVRQANRLVAEWGGRIYLAKDALLDAPTFAAMTPRLDQWRALRAAWDPRGLWRTDLSTRLEL
jgi:decaprenylphospho-beta-D-ribofuranose 2-oxidase